VQVLLGAMLIDALHAALEDRKVSFRRIGVNGLAVLITDILANAVFDRLVIRNVVERVIVEPAFIGMKAAFAR
jgi:hypothetical protein